MPFAQNKTKQGVPHLPHEAPRGGYGADPIVRVTVVGMITNVFLSVIKIVVGVMVNSISLLADGVHSFSDLLTDVAVLVGSRIGNRPADDNHPYGHGKYETFASVFVSVVLILVAGGIIWNSAHSFLNAEFVRSPRWVMVVAVVSILLKEWLFRITRRVALGVRSAAALANAWHHRSDAFSSIAVLLGGIAGCAGYPHGDSVAGVVVGVMVVTAGFKLLSEAMMELSEASAETRFQKALTDLLNETPEVLGWHACRGRHVGREVFLDCHIQVDADLSVRHSHELTGKLKKQLRRRLGIPVNLLIHVEPFEGEVK